MNTQGIVARHWIATEDGRVQCLLCPHECRIADGRGGLCFVRRNEGGRLLLVSGYRVSGVSADPIEKKPLYHFLPGTRSLSIGTIGCNLSCRFCQNWHISQPKDLSALEAALPPEDLADAAVRMGCPSVSFTYNEPIVSFEYVVAAARACRARGLRTVAVTAGYIHAEPRAEFFAEMDAANVDLKAFRDDFYHRLCGARLAPVLDTLRFLAGRRVWMEITTLLIPGENDSGAEIREMSQWALDTLGADVPLHFSAFHPMHRLLDRASTPSGSVRRARDIARECGLRHVYTGNILDDEGSTTYCPGCGRPVVDRRGFGVVRRGLDAEGHCLRCGAACPGVFA